VAHDVSCTSALERRRDENRDKGPCNDRKHQAIHLSREPSMHSRLAAAAPFLFASLAVGQTSPTTLSATPSTVVWGYYSAKAKPVLTVHSGDTVRIQTLSTCGSTERMLGEGVAAADIPSYNADIYREVKGQRPGRPHPDRPSRDRRGRTRRCARSANSEDRYRRALRLQRLRSGAGIPAQRLSLQPNEDHSSRPRKDGR
jgi:hypothetical protein